MNRDLRVLLDGAQIGTLAQSAKGKLGFTYDAAWRTQAGATPLSLSMPLSEPSHTDPAVSAYLWGLLPDNEQTLDQIGKRYGVSPRNPFALIAAQGEDLQGGVQMVDIEAVAELKKSEGLKYLTRKAVTERFAELMRDPSATRFTADGGKFSLAGAQRKLALCLIKGRWAEPRGRTPSTHILKPNIDGLPGQAYNEMFCLRLAPMLGLPAPPTWVESFGDARVIVIERYDRLRLKDGQRLSLTEPGGEVHRVHQEDMCQAMGVLPFNKYQRDGGPGMQKIMALLSGSGEPSIDRDRFMRSCAYNYVLTATDAHAKNYSLLLTVAGLYRLAPLYDIASWLPYAGRQRENRLAMSVDGYYDYNALQPRHWEAAARKCSYDPQRILGHIRDLLFRLPDEAAALQAVCVEEGVPAGELNALAGMLRDRVAQLIKVYGAEAMA
jgi:serine/threonine-protein kinase HipA